MKILFAPAHYMLDSTVGGSEFSWADNLIRSLAAYPDIEVVVAIAGLVKSSVPYPPNVRIVTVDKRSHLHLTWSYRLWFVFKNYLAARRILRSRKIDIVHHILPFGFNTTFNLLPLLGTLKGIPFVLGPLQAPHTYNSDEEFIIYSQGKFVKYNGIKDMLEDRIGQHVHTVSRDIFRRLSIATLRRSAAITVVNEDTRDLYARQAPGLSPIVISPGIRVAPFLKEEVKKTGSGSSIEIITVGSLIKRKGINFLLDAMAVLRTTHPQIRLRIVGDGPQRQALEHQVRTLALQDIVTFQGFVPNAEIPALYHAADIYVSMSFSESFGQTLVEAMAAGLCVVAAANTGSRGIIQDGQTGFLVQPGNAEDLVRVLRRLCDDPALRASVALAGQRESIQRYDWSAIAAQYIELYKDVLARHAKAVS